MNRLDYNQDGGFRLSTNILSAAQTAYTLFNQLGWLGGNLTIITGCVTTGTNVSDGYVFINGEVLPFIGGSIGTNVIIQQNVISYPFQNGTSKPVIYERSVTFGTAAPEDTYLWSDFKRVFQTKDIQTFKDNFESRITALENKASDVPAGTIVRYNQPLIILPPAGWADYHPTDEQGRVWAARSDSDSDFGLGVKNGTKTHQLINSELPKLEGTWQTLAGDAESGSGVIAATGASNAYVLGNIAPGWKHKHMKISFGNNQPHNNLQPYVAVRFIIKL